VMERGQTGSETSWAGGGILSPLLPWDYPRAVSALRRIFPYRRDQNRVITH
jgi:hypothetical protein